MKKIIILIAVCLVVALCISLISIPHKGKWVDPKQIAVSKVEEKRMNSHIIPLDFACTEDGTTFLLISYPLDKDMYLLKSNDKGLTWSAPAKIGHGEYGCMEAVGNQVYVMGIGYDEKFFQKFNNKGEAIGKKHYFYETKLNFGKMLVKDKDNIFILVIRSEMLSFTKSAD